MDLEMENRIAAVLLKEAAELRRQAQTEGALAYLRQPTVRSRPNARFLTATVLGVQQANRIVEVNEMWRLREKQMELDYRLVGKKDASSSGRSDGESDCGSHRNAKCCNEVAREASAAFFSNKRNIDDPLLTKDKGLRDAEVEEFLHSRTKRGRGSIGSRMDETGPYLPSCADSKRLPSPCSDIEPKKHRVIYGPEKPVSFNYKVSSDNESQDSIKVIKKKGSSKRRSRKHKSKGEYEDKKKRRKDEKRKKLRK